MSSFTINVPFEKLKITDEEFVKRQELIKKHTKNGKEDLFLVFNEYYEWLVKKENNMTIAEEKVREISDKLVNRIDELRDEGYQDASILSSVRNYLIGLTDGIDFAEEMRNQD